MFGNILEINFINLVTVNRKRTTLDHEVRTKFEQHCSHQFVGDCITL